MNLKHLLTAALRLQLQLLWRQARYVQFGYKWASTTDELAAARIRLTQPIKKNYLFENKLHNLQLASGKVSSVVVQPNEVFSYWRLVGAPNKANGYRKGRNLINGELKEDYGGGLCQLSGILYHLALLAQLEILERHHHSMDIYTEEERFTPLGADATVVYGYKDLLIRNNLPYAVRFHTYVDDLQLHAALHCESELQQRRLKFERITHATHKEVHTVDEQGAILASSVYRNNSK